MTREKRSGRAEGVTGKRAAAKEAADAAAAKAKEAGEAADERAQEAAPDAEGDERPVDDKSGEPDQPPRRPRGAAETSTRTQRRRAPRRSADGEVTVSARARYVRSAPRKARLVMQHIRGKRVPDAIATLDHTPRAVSRDVLKLLRSAIANAESNHELAADELRVASAYVDEGPIIKRYQPRALGRATRINKRTSHMTITLTTEVED
jgi:ribosomal protein L22